MKIKKLFVIVILSTIFMTLAFQKANGFFPLPGLGGGLPFGGGAFVGDIYGVILDAESLKPIKDARVVPLVKQGRASKTDENGHYSCKGRIESVKFGYTGVTEDVYTMKGEPIKFIVSKNGYKTFRGKVYPYHQTLYLKQTMLGIGSGMKGFNFMMPILLAKAESSEKSGIIEDFNKRFFTPFDISFNPSVIVKKNKVKIEAKALIIPEGRLPTKVFTCSLADKKKFELKIEKPKTAWTAEPERCFADISINKKPGLYPFVLYTVLEKDKWLETSDWTYIIRVKDETQKDVAINFLAGIEKLKEGDIQNAISIIEDSISRVKDFAPFYWGLSLAYEKNDNLDKAIENAEKAISIDKKFSLAYLQAGQLYVKKKNIENAKKYLDSAAKLSYPDEDYYKILGDAYFEAGIFESAKKQYEKGFKLNKDPKLGNLVSICKSKLTTVKKPKDSKAYLTEGAAYREFGMLDEAEIAFKKAIETNPKNDLAYNQLGLVYSEKDEDRKEIECYRKAIEINPNYKGKAVSKSKGVYHYNLGIKLKEVDSEIDEQLKAFEKAFKMNDKDEDYKSEYELALAKKKYKDAPNDLNVAVELAGCYVEDVDYNNAIELSKKAIETKQDFVRGYTKLAYAHLGLGDNEEALSILNKALKINPNDAEVHYVFGKYYENMGDNTSAKSEYEKVVKFAKKGDEKIKKDAEEMLKGLK